MWNWCSSLQNFRWKGLTAEEARRRIKARFYQFPQAAGDSETIDMMLFRGEIDLYEMYQQHSTQSQLQHFIKGSPDKFTFFDRVPRRLPVAQQVLKVGDAAKSAHTPQQKQQQQQSSFLERFFEKNLTG